MNDYHNNIGRVIGRLYNLMRRSLFRDCSSLGCSGAEIKILTLVLTMDEPVFQKDIEKEFFLRPPTATEILKRMENDGLINRMQEEGDARKKRITATAPILARKDEILGSIHAFERDITADLSEEEIRTFCSVAEKMQQNLMKSKIGRNLEEDI